MVVKREKTKDMESLKQQKYKNSQSLKVGLIVLERRLELTTCC